MIITAIICLTVFSIVHRISRYSERADQLKNAYELEKLQFEREKLEQKEIKQLPTQSSHPVKYSSIT